jgi:hypothetical protein
MKSILGWTFIKQLVPDSAQPHVITAAIPRFLNMSLKEANWTLNLWC